MKKYMLKPFCVVLIQMFSYSMVFADAGILQASDITISGTVTGETGDPIVGATVLVEGSSTETITNADGKYTLSVPEGATLVFSFIGFESQRVTIGELRVIDVVLRESAASLEEVVVVGFGVQQKLTVTGAISTVDASEIRAIPVGDAASRLQGRVAGVTVTSGHDPSGSTVVRVRGIGSVNNNNPLFVVDGMPVDNLIGINPNDIESMTVLKDAGASAIYGSRAANGVIIVTTNRGQYSGPVLFNFSARSALQQPIKYLELMNTEESGLNKFQRMKNDGLVPGGPGWGDLQYGYGPEPVIPDYVFPARSFEGDVDESLYNYPFPYYGITRANKEGTDWQREIFSVAPLHEYNIGISGGSNSSRFNASGSYFSNSGIQNHTGFDRYSLRGNSDFKLASWVVVGQTLGATYTVRSGQSGNGGVAAALRMPAILPVYDIQGNFAGSKSPGLTNGTENPVAQLYRAKDDFSRQIHLLGSTYVQVNLGDFFVRSTLGVDLNNNRTKNIGRMNPEHVSTNLSNSLNESNTARFRYDWANTLNYRKTINENHNVTALLGTEAIKNHEDLISSAVTGFAFEDVNYMVLSAGEEGRSGTGSFNEWAIFSYFGRLNYNYKERYMFEAVLRRDASSRFIGENRWGTFPAFSAGWRIIQDRGVIPAIDDLGLRLSWGQNGNDNVGNYNSFSGFRSNIMESYYNITGAGTNSSEAGFSQYSQGNPEGRWETNTTTNIGLDIRAFNGRMEFNFDAYTRTTSDMLYPDSRPATWGQLTFPAINIGEMRNTGFDAILSYRGGKSQSDFSYTISGNLSRYKNKVINLNLNPNEFRYGFSFDGDPYTITKAGYPISSFFGYVVEGYFNTQEDIDAWPKYNPSSEGVDDYSRLGAFKFKDVNGDGIINADDRTIIGNPHPDFTYGINFDLQYKNWDMNMFLQGVQGNDLANFAKRFILFSRYDGNYLKERYYESWTPERYAAGEKITVPITTNSDGILQRSSTYYIEDGSYLRLKNIEIGYTLPDRILSPLNIQRIRVALQAVNLFTFTKYKGLDPEISSGNDLSFGVDNSIYPTARIFSLAVNINL